MLNITDDYNSFTNCTNIDKEDIGFIFKILLLSFPSSVMLLSNIDLIIRTRIKLSING